MSYRHRTCMRAMIMTEFAELLHTQPKYRELNLIHCNSQHWNKKSTPMKLNKWSNLKWLLLLLLLLLWFLHFCFCFWCHIWSHRIKLADFYAEKKVERPHIYYLSFTTISTECKISLISSNDNYRSSIKNVVCIQLYSVWNQFSSYNEEIDTLFMRLNTQ